MEHFIALAELAEQMSKTSSRLTKRAAIAEAIARVAGGRGEAEIADAGRFALYLAGLPFPEADSRKLSAGGALLSKAVLAVSGATGAQLTAAYRRHGDLGAAAFDLLVSRDGGRQSEIGLAEVAEGFAGMATAKTTAARAAIVQDLLKRSLALEAKYLLKLMLGDMRIGVKQSLVEEGIAVAAGVEVTAVRHAVMLEADLAAALCRAFEGTLGQARMRLFHPLGFMLASPVETPEEAVERFTAKPPKAEAEKKPARKKPTGKGGKQAAKPVEVDEPEAFEDLPETDIMAEIPDDVRFGGSEDCETAVSPAATVDEGSPVGVQAFLEDKYDGMRAQVHCGDPEQPGRVAIYSRNREDITESFPELAEAFGRVGEASVGGLIFDGEILGWDMELARALPFALLGQRIGRKRVSNEMRRQIPVIFMVFDLMFAEGELQLGTSLRERRNKLESIVEELSPVVSSPLEGTELHRAKAQASTAFQTGQGALFLSGEDEPLALIGAQPGSSAGVTRLMISPSRLVQSAEDIDRAYGEARARANEGVMLKAANSLYQPGRRGLAWVKLKRELATLDVVITGAEFGSGRRARFLSDYTFAVRGPGGELLNVGKAYSGVTDAEIVELTEWLKAHTLEDTGHFRTVEPTIVLEVAFNNVMRSERHASGYALRFPRILRIRTDKPVEEIDTVARVEEVYQSQVDKPLEV